MTTDPASTMRAALATAISERDTAKQALRIASESAERANELLQAAKVKLAAFGDVDHEILQHRAASFKAAVQRTIPKATLELPEELICRERARDEAAATVRAVQAAHTNLVGEFAEAQASWRKAERNVSEAANSVLVAEIAARGQALTDIWNNLWATIDSLNALRTSLHVKLPNDVIRTLNSFESLDHRQFPGGRNEQLARASQHWRSYHTALCKCADATQPDPNNESVSSAVTNRVA
jgi:hypothetical protein